ncbi:MAG: AAA family ATPase [Candidatus Scalindua sp.]
MTNAQRSEDVSDIKNEIDRFRKDFSIITEEIGKVIVGNKDIVEKILIAFFSKGHVLLEGVPGLGKTLLVKSLSKALGFDFKRIQFTPDLMPADITGTQIVVERGDGRKEFEFRPGPLFTNILLADEINRATPKTQSAMLEAMEERQVTVAGKTHGLREPFFVMATQNPIEMEGTYTLPEAQMDRFFFRLQIAFPKFDELKQILRQTTINESYTIKPVFNPDSAVQRVSEMRKLVREVLVSSEMEDYITNIILASHPGNKDIQNSTTDGDSIAELIGRYVTYGAGPRGAQAVTLAAKATALLDGRPNIYEGDVKKVAVSALNHRMLLNFEADADNIKSEHIIEEILAKLEK